MNKQVKNQRTNGWYIYTRLATHFASLAKLEAKKNRVPYSCVLAAPVSSWRLGTTGNPLTQWHRQGT
jgi:hypothetical protein